MPAAYRTQRSSACSRLFMGPRESRTERDRTSDHENTKAPKTRKTFTSYHSIFVILIAVRDGPDMARTCHSL
jgi:hypothetical protein